MESPSPKLIECDQEEEKRQLLLGEDIQKKQKSKTKQIPVYWKFAYGTIDVPDLQSEKSDSKSSSSDEQDPNNIKSKQMQEDVPLVQVKVQDILLKINNIRQGGSSSAPESPDKKPPASSPSQSNEYQSIEDQQVDLAIQQSIQDQFKNLQQKAINQSLQQKKQEQQKKVGSKDQANPGNKNQKPKIQASPPKKEADASKQQQQKGKKEIKKNQQLKEKAKEKEQQKKKSQDENAQKKKEQEEKAAKKKRDRQLQLKRRKERERQILKSQEIAHVKLKCGGHAYVPGNTLQQEISLHIKTFFGVRRKFTFRVNIQDRVETLKEMLMAADQTGELKHYQDIRLYYVMVSQLGNINELVFSKTFQMLNIPHNAQLILSGTKTFQWNPKKKGPNINVSHNSLTVSKSKDVTHQSILTTIGFCSGSHYWEISVINLFLYQYYINYQLDTLVDIQDIFIGICLQNTPLNKNPYELNSFWGFVPAAAKKFEPGASPGAKAIVSDYGPMCQIKDIIGVCLEFSQQDKTGTLSFFRNKVGIRHLQETKIQKKIGVAINKIPPNTYYPAICLYYGEAQVTLNAIAKNPSK